MEEPRAVRPYVRREGQSQISKEELDRRGMTNAAINHLLDQMMENASNHLHELKCVRSFLLREDMSTADVITAAKYIMLHPEIVAGVKPESTT